MRAHFGRNLCAYYYIPYSLVTLPWRTREVFGPVGHWKNLVFFCHEHGGLLVLQKLYFSFVCESTRNKFFSVDISRKFHCNCELLGTFTAGFYTLSPCFGQNCHLVDFTLGSRDAHVLQIYGICRHDQKKKIFKKNPTHFRLQHPKVKRQPRIPTLLF